MKTTQFMAERLIEEHGPKTAIEKVTSDMINSETEDEKKYWSEVMDIINGY